MSADAVDWPSVIEGSKEEDEEDLMIKPLA